MKKKAFAGNTGDKVRSDCFITMEKTASGNIDLHINSKVQTMFGSNIKKLCLEILDFFDIKGADITVDDKGALPFVIAARLEACIKQLIPAEKEYLPEFIPENRYSSSLERFRISRLYLPGNTPQMMINAGIHNPDGIILDLEDSVAPDKKEEARLLVRNALRSVNFYGAERMVRINQVPNGLKDLKYIVPHNLHLILIPKCEGAEQVKQVETVIRKLKKEQDIKQEIYFMPVIESCLGVENAFEIASASKNVAAMALGLEDYTADLGVMRTNEAKESLYARTRMVNACKAAGIQAIDSVFSDVDDTEGLKATIKESKSLGFEGMGCIHPRQIKTIHECYAPDPAEIEKARRIVEAFKEAQAKGLGVVALGSKMIDAPVVKRAEKILSLAEGKTN